MRSGVDRRDRLRRAHLYLVTDLGMPLSAVEAALDGGVDMVQVRDRGVEHDVLVEGSRAVGELCERFDALLWVNDDPGLALEVGADGVHVGQDDEPVTAVRERVGEDVLIGLSTHSPEQLAAGAASDADQLSVGPVWETPTKPGRAATGLESVRVAAAAAVEQPWFAIGGIDARNVDDVVTAGARRVVVVRAIRDAADPRAAAAALRAAVAGGDRVGAAR